MGLHLFNNRKHMLFFAIFLFTVNELLHTITLKRQRIIVRCFGKWCMLYLSVFVEETKKIGNFITFNMRRYLARSKHLLKASIILAG